MRGGIYGHLTFLRENEPYFTLNLDLGRDLLKILAATGPL
jgi:hypothetical protein